MEKDHGSDGLTRAEVWKLLDTYQQQWRDRFERHANALDRNTAAMTDGFNSIRKAMDDDAGKVRAVADRVLTIETERGIEKRAASQHGAIAGSLSAGAVMGIVEGLKRLFGAHG